MSTQWKLTVNRYICIGSGLCAGTAPRYFHIGPDHRSHPVSPLIDPDEKILDVAVSCPVEAITIVESDTERALFPENGPNEAFFPQQSSPTEWL